MYWCERMKAAIYARVSTVDKDQNPETQLMACREYCQSADYEIYKEYVDKARARDLKGRKQWQMLEKDARQRRFGTIVFLRLDRPFRSVQHCANTLTEFDSRNITIEAVQQNIETKTAMGRYIITIMTAAAELESAWIGERVKAGMDRAKAEGKRIGRKPLGITFEQVIEALHNETSISAAARALNCSRRHIHRICEDHDLVPMVILDE